MHVMAFDGDLLDMIQVFIVIEKGICKSLIEDTDNASE